MARSRKYKALSLVSVWLFVIGVIGLIVTVIMAAVLLLNARNGWLPALGVVAYGVPASIITIAYSQLIDLLIDCEEHLRELRRAPMASHPVEQSARWTGPPEHD